MITFLSVALTAATSALISLYLYAESKRRQVVKLQAKIDKQREIIKRQDRELRASTDKAPIIEAELEWTGWQNY